MLNCPLCGARQRTVGSSEKKIKVQEKDFQTARMHYVSMIHFRTGSILSVAGYAISLLLLILLIYIDGFMQTGSFPVQMWIFFLILLIVVIIMTINIIEMYFYAKSFRIMNNIGYTNFSLPYTGTIILIFTEILSIFGVLYYINLIGTITTQIQQSFLFLAVFVLVILFLWFIGQVCLLTGMWRMCLVYDSTLMRSGVWATVLFSIIFPVLPFLGPILLSISSNDIVQGMEYELEKMVV